MYFLILISIYKKTVCLNIGKKSKTFMKERYFIVYILSQSLYEEDDEYNAKNGIFDLL
jgi:hypothetical protein